MKFAELKTGDVIDCGSYTLQESEVLAFAQQYDPQWFHTDQAAAKAGRFQGLIASGWQTCGIAMRLATLKVLQGSESFASPGVKNIQWLAPVRPGDTLTLHAHIVNVRLSSKQPTLGVLDWRWELFNQHETMVLSVEATSLFDLKAP